MSELWEGFGICPCGSADINPPDEGSFASCEECGEIFMDPYTLSIMEEAKREYDEARRVCWPNPVPSYREWANRRKGEYLD
jgi:hypothetical protein